MGKIVVLTNPNAKKNKKDPDKKGKLEEVLGENGLVIETKVPEDIQPVADRLFGEDNWRDMYDLIKPNSACFHNAEPEMICSIQASFAVSLGSNGVRLEEHHLDGLYTEQEIMAERPDGSLVDPCSCGDSLMAGIVVGFLLELDMLSSVMLGNFLAARTASHLGSYYNKYEEARYFLQNRLNIEHDILKGDLNE